VRIDFAEEGGFFHAFGNTIEGERLEPGKRTRLETLVEAAKFFELPESTGKAAGGVDCLQHRLTIEDHGRRHTVRVLVPIADPALQELVMAVQRLVRAPRRRRTPMTSLATGERCEQ
jgi:Emfourin